MTTGAPAADSNFLTIDQVVANLDAAEIEQEKEEAPSEENLTEREKDQDKPTEAEPAAEGAAEPETATDDETAETEDDAEEAEEAELPAIEPPRFWDADAKARFRELPRDIQELLSQNEDRSVKATAKSLQEAAERRNAADQEASNLAALRSELDKSIETAKTRFKSKWDNVDWNAVIDQYGADQALKFKNEFEADQAAIAKAERDATVAETVELRNFTAREMAKLPELAPDLADPKTGPQRLEVIGKTLAAAGYTTKQIQWMHAFSVSVLNDALKWREANADAKAKIGLPKTAPKPAAPAKPSVKATASPARSGSPQSARIQTLQRKPNLTVDEAVELMDLQGT